MNKLRVFTAFSGYDSQCLALNRLKESNPDFDYELVGWSEIDKYAVQAHNALFPHWSDRNLGDISKIDWTNVPDFDLFTYSSPCQDFSIAGLQRGGEKESGTRSSLLWECEKAIITKRPKYCILENVKALVSKKFIDLFMEWCEVLGSYGYTNYWQVLNAKDYGVPQNRERVFLVSVLDGREFKFPKPVVLSKRLKDILEEKVEDRYYLSTERVGSLFKKNEENKEKGVDDIKRDSDKGCRSVRIEAMIKTGKIPEDEVYIDAYNQRTHKDYTACLRAGNKGLDWVKIKEPTICRQVGRNPDNPTCRKSGIPTKQMIEVGGTISHCLSTVQKDNMVCTPNYRIRKLTPSECFRLMGVLDADILKIQEAGISNTQQYKMAGNSIVVDVLYYIFRNLIYPGLQKNGVGPAKNDIGADRLYNIYGPDKGMSFAGNVWDKEKIAPTLTTMGGGMRQPLIIENASPEIESTRASRPFRLHFSINITI